MVSKILAKSLDLHLVKSISKLVSGYQSGFILQRSSKMGLRQKIIKCVQLIHSSSKVSIHISLSSLLSFGRDARQGFMDSSLLFALAIKPVAAAMRHHLNVTILTRHNGRINYISCR